MTEAVRTVANCAGTRADGQPCGAPIAGDDGYCYSHDPTRSIERHLARRRGGQNSASAARLRGLVPPRLLSVYGRLEAALEDVRTGTLTPQQATAMASVARALVSVLTAGELEQRVRDLEGKGDGP